MSGEGAETPGYAATLRVVSARLTCAELTAAMGIPDTCHEKGTKMSPRSPRSAVRNAALWLVHTEPSEAPLERHVRALLTRVDAAAVASLAAGDGVEADVFCLVRGDATTTLPAALLGEVAEMEAELVLDVYPPGPEDEVDEEGDGKRAEVTFTTGAGEVLRGGGPGIEERLAALADDPRVGADGQWDVAYASANGQGSIELGVPWLARLAEIGAPLTVRLVRWATP
ncbi:MAG TPA: DUF4279 domain-containing protein [Frankiaceae bacterium]|jgi:hypothetical protein|nr:DUF4279 domain-containing protein [Frankiaceae bacterium]